jgi:hypothetical protein
VIQPIDVAIASPLKTYFKEELSKRLHHIVEGDPDKREKTDLLRLAMCEAFCDAYRKATTRANCIAGFRAAGMFPFDPEIPLTSQYIIESQGAPANGAHESPLNGNLLTGDDGLNAVSILQFGRVTVSADRLRGTIGDVCHRLRTATVVDGRQISPFPAIFRQIGPSIWEEATL